MTFFFLPKQHPQTQASLPDGRFYTKDWLRSYIVQVPHGCVPVWCEYTGDWKNHSWTNPISGLVYEKHPLGLTMSDGDFLNGFYEIAEIEGLTFGEGDAWCLETNAMIRVEKPDPLSVWNPFFQRYDPPCNNHFSCKGVKKEMESSSGLGSYLYLDDIFTNCRHLFLDVYCGCDLNDGYEPSYRF